MDTPDLSNDLLDKAMDKIVPKVNGFTAEPIKPYRLIIFFNLDSKHRKTLSQHFTLIDYSDDLKPDVQDAGFIDCRGEIVKHPEHLSKKPLPFTFALVDEHSRAETPQYNYTPTGHINRLELVTESELTGHILKLRMDARPVRTVRRAPAYFTPAHESLTSRTQELRDNSFDLLQHFLTNSTDWIVVKDLEHRFMAVSGRFLQSHNLKPEQVIGKNDLEIGTDPELVLGSPERQWKGFWKLDDEVTDSGKPNLYHHVVVQENSLTQIREHVAKIPLFNKQGDVYALMVCITQSHMEKINGVVDEDNYQLRSVEQSPLVLKLRSDRQQAEAAKLRTQSAFRRKNNFIATASHDLRQPLHAIGLFIESLESQITNTGHRSTLAKMKQSTKNLNALLNSILDISKLDADAVEVDKTNFSIAQLLNAIENEFEPEAKSKSLKFTVNHVNTVVHTDSLLLMRIVRNLVSNAVKHTDSGSINIVNYIGNDSLILEVRDTGPGIPKAQYEAIFSEYLQLNQNSDQPNFGMGLGLSIVKRLTELLELEISLDSRVNEGTCFSLTIPLGNALVSEQLAVEHKKSINLQSYRIMIIEDDQVVLDAMHQMLSSMECEAYPAANIAEALEIVNELDKLPDLLLVDYQLADGVTGDTAIKAVCEAAGNAIPAIIVTGNTNSSLIRQASQSTYPVLNKPVSPDVLINNIGSAIREQRAENLLIENNSNVIQTGHR